jgi:hypothetical protein
MSEFYTHGAWHAMIGLSPQYDHMEGTPMHSEYMEGYQSVKKDQPVSVSPTENSAPEKMAVE